MAKDKLRVDSLNRYLYVVNNPVNLVDPSGMQIFIDESGRILYDPKTKKAVDTFTGKNIETNQVDNYIANGYQNSCSEVGDQTANNNISLLDVIYKTDKEIPPYEKLSYFYKGIYKGIISDAELIYEMQKYNPISPQYYKRLADDIYKLYNYEETVAEIRQNSEQFINYIKSININKSYNNLLKDMYDNPERLIEYEGRFSYETTKLIIAFNAIAKNAKAKKVEQLIDKADDVADIATDIGKYGDDVNIISKTKISSEDIKFSDKFLKGRYKTQVAERGWTKDMIVDTLNHPVKTVKSVNKATGNPATIYFRDNVHGIVRDDVTDKIIQISDLEDSEWIFHIYK